MIPALLLASLSTANERCGPNRCPDGESCGNASCGLCAPPGGAVIQPHCGWERNQISGSVPLVPAPASRPGSVGEVDVRLVNGRIGDTSVAGWQGHLRAPLSVSSILVGSWHLDGSSHRGVGTRHERYEVGAVWSPPMGTPDAQGALEAGIALARASEVRGSGWLAPLRAASDAGSLRPRGWMGVSLVQQLPRWLWYPGLFSASLKVFAGNTSGDLSTGYVATGSVSQHYGGGWTIGWMAGFEAEHEGGPPRLQAPLGLYVLGNRRFQAGLEGGPAWQREDGAWRSGAFAAARVRVMMTPAEAAEGLRTLLDRVRGGPDR